MLQVEYHFFDLQLVCKLFTFDPKYTINFINFNIS